MRISRTFVPTSLFFHVRDKYQPAFIGHDQGVSTGASYVYILIFTACGEKDHCWLSQTTMALRSKSSVRTIQNYLNELVKTDYISIQKGEHGRNIYTLLLSDRLIALLKAFRSRHPNLRLILEPGSAFTWRTGYLVSTVEDVVENGGVHTAMLDVSFACHMPDCLEMPYKPAIVGAREPQEGDRRWRMGGNSCLAGDYCGDWAFDHELQVGERIVFEDMIHYTMVKTTMFNGVAHPAIAVADADGAVRIVREFGYADFKGRMS